MGEMEHFETYFLNDKEEFETFKKEKRKRKWKGKQKGKGKKENEKFHEEHDENEEMKLTHEKIKKTSPIVLMNCSVGNRKKRKLVKHNVYEGGYTIWDCTWEMLKFIYKEKIAFKNNYILELGCGNGLVGIYILKSGGTVVFQELNKEVINDLLLPNIKHNLNVELKKKELEEKATFMKIKSGKTKCFIVNKSWEELEGKLEEKKLQSFDYIFGNEILYRYENYNSVLHILERHLKKGGKAFFGLKSFYFGFAYGTGSKHFTWFVNSNKESPFVAKIIKSIRHKSSAYTKDIVQVSHKE